MTLQQLTVSSNQRYLSRKDGTPFFYLADTAWELFHRLNREEAQLYLKNRADKGFTVIQAVVLAELDGLNTPNPYGDVPLINHDPTQPNPAYFQHVDFIVNAAEQLGLYVGMLPTWGDKVQQKSEGGLELFTPETAFTYGEYLGQRYRQKPIIWILGGDRDPHHDEQLAIWRSMAAGLKQGDGGAHLITFHCQTNSARWFHHDDWLDFNMFQSGHGGKDTPNYRTTAYNYQLSPPKPTLDGEPRYEDIPVRFWENQQPRRRLEMIPMIRQIARYWRGRFNDYDVRQAAYWSLFAGACGHTYGNNSVWQLWEPGRESFVPARLTWKDALDRPGAVQMGYVRRLFESRPFQKLVPDASLLDSKPGTGASYTSAMRAEDGSFAFIYTATGRSVRVKLDALQGTLVTAHWYNPRTGQAQIIGQFSNQFPLVFKPARWGRGKDWVLVLDSAECKFLPPGEVPNLVV
ncbi:MAG: glycoside hydrolase family 140 protein [Elainellaceae cyanobacterium]